MGRLKIAALSGAALFFLPAVAAHAADIPQIPAPIKVGGGWYLRGDIGFTNQSVGSLFNAQYEAPGTVSITNVSRGFEAAPFAGVGVGYQFNDNFRMDVTGEYRAGATFHGLDIYDNTLADPEVGTDEYTGIKTEWTFLANAYWDMGTWHNITPYLGAGIGASFNTISGFTDVNTVTSGVAYGATETQTSLAWALYAGLGMKVTDNLTIDLGYRYIDLGNAHSGNLIAYDGTDDIDNPMEFRHLTSQDFKVGFRWALGGGSSKSYYPPVVKY
ncbi:MAG TPA: acyloxyacyl hydrolase [Bauldia sp.]|nr:acyloxyacyl hydrolase [Bauldia sp.]